jgi:hypothetical protein
VPDESADNDCLPSVEQHLSSFKQYLEEQRVHGLDQGRALLRLAQVLALRRRRNVFIENHCLIPDLATVLQVTRVEIHRKRAPYFSVPES